QCKHFTINQQGFRGAPVAVPKAPGTVRIAVLGRSTELGYSLADEESWPAQLEQFLNHDGATRYEVLNFGFIQQQLTRIIRLYERAARPLAPDVVLFSVGLRDLHANQRQSVWTPSRPPHRGLERVGDTLFVCHWLRTAFSSYRTTA